MCCEGARLPPDGSAEPSFPALPPESADPTHTSLHKPEDVYKRQAVSDVYHVPATRLAVLLADGIIVSYQKADWNIFPDPARTKIFDST